MNRRCGACATRCASGRPNGGSRRREDFSQFKIDHAEAAELIGVGDIAGFGVEVAHAVVTFEFGKDAIGLFLGDLAGRLTAVGGDEVEFLGVLLQQPRHVRALALLEHLEHCHFGGVALGGGRPTQALVDIAVKIDPHQ